MRKKSKIEKIIKKFNSMPEFEIHITKSNTRIVGNEPDIVAGLGILVNKLKEIGVDQKIIKYAVKEGLNADKEVEDINVFDIDID